MTWGRSVASCDPATTAARSCRCCAGTTNDCSRSATGTTGSQRRSPPPCSLWTEDGPWQRRVLHAGFDKSEYEVEARERWGTEAVDRGTSAWARLGEGGQDAHHAEATAIGESLAVCLADGVPVDSPRVQALVARHHAQIAPFWTPNRASYTGLGQMYVDDPRFAATYDAFAPGLARYLRDAMAVFAAADLD